jgi:hypothetical protein
VSPTDPAQAEAWQRQFAAALFNRTWDLLESPDRTEDDDDELLAAAFGSRFFWGRVGDASNRAVGDGQIARVCAELGHADLALRFASKGMAAVEAQGYTDFRLASAYEVMARAQACAGNGTERDRYVALATDAIATLEDPEDREIIEGQLATVPPARAAT